MKRTISSAMSIAVLLISMVVASTPAVAAPPLPDYNVIDAGPDLRSWEPTRDRIQGAPSGDLFSGAGSGSAQPADYAVGDAATWLGLDDYTGYYVFKPYTLMAMGGSAEIWVANNYQFPTGDPRNPVVITQDQINAMLDQVENNIYGKLTSFFRTPDYHDGTNSLLVGWGYVPPGYYDGDKLVILVDNIRDDNYYDPNYPLYIAGFYSPTFEAYFDRNIINIDAFDWANRTGPDGTRPYLYEGTVAHEFQHLLHDDADPDEETFVNEGLSDFAEYVAGYGHADGHLYAPRGLQAYPENSLVVWGDQGDLELLADYGVAYAWTYYLYEQFGKPFIQAMFNNPDNGISGVDSTLAAAHVQKGFGDLYHDFSVAMLIDSTKAGSRYGFKNLDFKLDIGTPSAPNPEAYDTPGAPPWGTDYIWIQGNPKDLAKFTFNGVDYSANPTAWSSDGDVLWGGTGNLVDNWAIFPAQGGGTLTFDTYYDIEDYWDFGFVQVSTDGGHTWTSLANAYTTSDYDPNAHPTVIANLPGLTGSSGGWLNMSFDLSAYAGQDILIAFRYVTDWSTLYAGWYIDNVYVDGTLISDGSSTAPFKDLSEILPINNDFTVTFVGIKEKRAGNEYKVLTMKLADMTEQGIFELNKVLKTSNAAVMLVTFDAPEGFTKYADYSYDFTYTNSGPKK
jgi:immune inhibitor A